MFHPLEEIWLKKCGDFTPLLIKVLRYICYNTVELQYIAIFI